jgi:hypothetical protein
MKYIVLLLIAHMTFFANAQMPDALKAHLLSRYPDYTSDYVVQKSTKKVLHQKDVPMKQRYVQVINNADGTPTFQEYSFQIGEELLYFKDGYYYSNTTGALLAPVPGTEGESEAQTKKNKSGLSAEQKVQIGMAVLEKVVQVVGNRRYGSYGSYSGGGQTMPGPQLISF